MLCREIIEKIEEKYGRVYGMEGDNTGFLVGRATKEVEHIYVAVDVSRRAVCRAKEVGADMLITHHPVIYSPIKQITDETALGRNLLCLIENKIPCYALHTNYDVVSMADRAAERMGLTKLDVLLPTFVEGKEEMGIGKVGNLAEEMSLEEVTLLVKNAFQAEGIRTFGNTEKTIRRVAICPGSGRSVLKNARAKGADVLITGDIGHHDGLDSVEEGMAVIDAGHYGIEHIFIQDFSEELRKMFPHIRITAEEKASPFFVR